MIRFTIKKVLLFHLIIGEAADRREKHDDRRDQAAFI